MADTSMLSNTMKIQQYDRKFSAVKSVAGTLHLSIYGALLTIPLPAFESFSMSMNILPRSSALNSFSSRSKQRAQKCKDAFMVVWNESFSCRMVWSVRQRTVNYVSGQICGVGSDTRTIGIFSMDMATFACTSERQVCRVPIITPSKAFSPAGGVIGYLVLSCEFATSIVSVPKPLSSDAFSTIMRSSFNEIQPDVTCTYMNEYELRLTVLSIEFLGLPYTKLADNTNYTLHLGSDDVSQSTFATIQSNKILIHDNVCVVRMYESGEASLLAHVFLTSDASTSTCRTTLVYPHSALSFSTPREFLLPMRNEEGHLVALLSCGCLSKRLHVADSMPPGDRILTINFLEGSILESDFIVPYFQCSVSGSKPHVIHDSDAAPCVLSTSCFEAVAENWNVGCTLPLAAVPSNKDVEKYEIPAWTLQIVCRDASRRENPIICEAQLTLPWAFLSEGGVIDKWIDVTAPSTSTALNKGRLHVQLSNSAELNTYFPGIGSVLVCLHNIDDASLGTSDMSFDVMSDFQMKNEEIMMGNSSSNTKKLRGNPSHYVATTPAVSCPVSGGRDIISIVVSSAERTEYTASFSTMSALPTASNSFEVPHLEISLHGNEVQSHGILKLSAIYVPYLNLNLKATLSCMTVQDNMQHLIKRLTNRTIYFRLCIGGSVVALTDATVFHQASSVKGFTEVVLNSYELLTVASTRKDDPFECTVALVVESKPGEYSSFAEGLIQLAPIFYCVASRLNTKEVTVSMSYSTTLFETIDRNPFANLTFSIAANALSVLNSVSRQVESTIVFDCAVSPSEHITEYTAKNFFSDLSVDNLTVSKESVSYLYEWCLF